MKEYVKKRTFPKKESAFLLDFMNNVKKRRKDLVWFFKSHGEPMMVRGIPDILMCYNGLFVGIEFKIMRQGKLMTTPYQEFNLECINKALGFGFVVWYDEANGNIGLNVKRFDNMEKCIDYLFETLDTFIKYPCCQFSTLRAQ